MIGEAARVRPADNLRAHDRGVVVAADAGEIPRVAAVEAYAKEHGVELRTVELDVGSAVSVTAGVARVLADMGRLDVIVHNAGHMDDLTMREFDALCLTPCPEVAAEDVVRIRTKSRASQSVFAAFLNVGKTTVAAWEQGTKKPSGPASKLLQIVDQKGLDALT